MTRQEHLEWAKSRALDYADKGDATNALASMGSDLDKHPETRGHAGVKLGLMLLMTGNLDGASEARKFIEGFN